MERPSNPSFGQPDATFDFLVAWIRILGFDAGLRFPSTLSLSAHIPVSHLTVAASLRSCSLHRSRWQCIIIVICDDSTLLGRLISEA
jgi:hypothetical protein